MEYYIHSPLFWLGVYILLGILMVVISAFRHPELIINRSKIILTGVFLFSPIVLLVLLLEIFIYIYRLVCRLVGNFIWSLLDKVAVLSPDYWHGERKEDSTIKVKMNQYYED